MPIGELMDPYHAAVLQAQVTSMILALASVVAAATVILKVRRRSKKMVLIVFSSVAGAVLTSIAALAVATMQVLPVLETTTSKVAEEATSAYDISVPASAVQSAWISQGSSVEFMAEHEDRAQGFLISISGKNGDERIQISTAPKRHP